MLLAKFERIYSKIFNAIDNPSLDKEDIEQIIDSDCSLTYSPSFFCITNKEKFSFDYISKNMPVCLGVPKSELIKNGMHYIWRNIHPKDLQCLYAALDELLYFINSSFPKKIKRQLSFSWNYRFIKNDGTYLNIIQNTTPFSLGLNKKGLTHFTVINSQYKIPIRISVGLLNANQDFETTFISNCSQRSFFKKISKREKDVIKLLTQKKSSKAIGKKLFISSNTVDTHRRNILKKLKLSSTGELVNMLNTQQNLF